MIAASAAAVVVVAAPVALSVSVSVAALALPMLKATTTLARVSSQVTARQACQTTTVTTTRLAQVLQTTMRVQR
jgi:hypothetical protein